MICLRNFSLLRYCVFPFSSEVSLQSASFNTTSSRHLCSTSKSDKTLISLFTPNKLAQVPNSQDSPNIGLELSNHKLTKKEIGSLLKSFALDEGVGALCVESAIDANLFRSIYKSFQNSCLQPSQLSPELHIKMVNILKNSCHVSDLFPFFLEHAKKIFPHLENLEDLKNISDLRDPCKWFAEARAMKRKIIFHSGPTNSGKTYGALQSFFNSKSGVYCGPLRLLANEVYQKCVKEGMACDLYTGEEIIRDEENPANHVSSTIEMVSTQKQYDCAVIDEIQMIKDIQRGDAWTRVLVGVLAKEIHVCGEEAAYDIVCKILESTDDEIELIRYKRLSPLHFEDQALQSLSNLQPGDCIVCFNKANIFDLVEQIKKIGKSCAVIYATKIEQAQIFNDLENPCKILVSTDAIGMGLNLSIRRIIFYSLKKPTIDENTFEMKQEILSSSQALQIAGRAGRFSSHFQNGFVTTFFKVICTFSTKFCSEDLNKLRKLQTGRIGKAYCDDQVLRACAILNVNEKRDLSRILIWLIFIGESALFVSKKAGISPSFEQIEMFSYILPSVTLSNLYDIFSKLSSLDNSKYFFVYKDSFKFFAEKCQPIEGLDLKTRFILASSPISTDDTFAVNILYKFAKKIAEETPITKEWLAFSLGWPLSPPSTIKELLLNESCYEVLNLYLWLSHRIPEIFHHYSEVKAMAHAVERNIREGMRAIPSFSSKRGTSKIHKFKPMIEKMQKACSGVEFGDMTSHLLLEGVLSPEMIGQLNKEWRNMEEKIK